MNRTVASPAKISSVKQGNAKHTFTRIVSRQRDQPHRYIKIQIMEHRCGKLSITPKELKHAINMSMKALFGSMGGCTAIDLLKFDTESNIAIIRCPSRYYVKVRGCLFFISKIGERSDVSLHVLQSSAHLMALACDSRDYMSSLSAS
ncbi:ribonuclease P protein subunit p14-like [Watersipora subatra]|uniref:ribonuclease P protein subunit p14-like n=1 Tax=Watersipora subatra TaxID=2589382 RepID=UPI00355B0F71